MSTLETKAVGENKGPPESSSEITNQNHNKETFKLREWNLTNKFYLSNLGDNADKYEIEKFFKRYGKLKNIWAAKNPPGFAFIEYEDPIITECAFKDIYGIKTFAKREVPKGIKYWQKHPNQIKGGHKAPATNLQPVNIKQPVEERPGDWLCQKEGCLNVNFSWRESCNKCNTRNPSIKETREERTKRIYSSNAGKNRGDRGDSNSGISVRISNRKESENIESHLPYRGYPNPNRYQPHNRSHPTPATGKPYNRPPSHQNYGKPYHKNPSEFNQSRPFNRPPPNHNRDRPSSRGPSEYHQSKVPIKQEFSRPPPCHNANKLPNPQSKPFNRPPPDHNRNRPHSRDPSHYYQSKVHVKQEFSRPPPGSNGSKHYYRNPPENNQAKSINRDPPYNPNLRYLETTNSDKSYDINKQYGRTPIQEKNHYVQSNYNRNAIPERNYNKVCNNPRNPNLQNNYKKEY